MRTGATYLGIFWSGRLLLGVLLVFAIFQSSATWAQVEKSSPASVQEAKMLRERLNQIFYWHLADELKLSPKQELEVKALLQKLQQDREKALSERQLALESLKKLPKEASLAQSQPFLTQYQNAIETLASSDKEEFNELKKIIGPELLARFYIVREEVTSRIRDALSK